jgi:hypothetical protein
VVLAVLIAAVGVYLLAASRVAGAGSQVKMWSAAGDTLVCGLSETRTIRLSGLHGETLVQVEGGCIRFVSSPCPHKVCIRRGAISRCGEWIACVPNGVVAVVRGERDYDGITP